MLVSAGGRKGDDRLRTEPGGERGRVPLRDQPTVRHDEDPVGELFGFLHVVAGEQDGGPLPAQLLDRPPGLPPCRGVAVDRSEPFMAPPGR
jgi:hypothetical protein